MKDSLTIENLKSLELKREAAKATMAKKAKTYNLIIRISSIISFISSTVTTILLFLYATSHQSLLPAIYVFSTILCASILTHIITFLIKKIWEHKLQKIGLSPLIEGI